MTEPEPKSSEPVASNPVARYNEEIYDEEEELYDQYDEDMPYPDQSQSLDLSTATGSAMEIQFAI